MEQTYDVIEVTAPHPRAGRIAVVPVRKQGFKLRLRNARFRVCNVAFDFADGFACGIITERRK